MTDELVLTALCKRFGGVIALDDVHLRLRPDVPTGLIGPNGSGKTTLFNVICGFLRPDAGTLTWRGRTMYRTSPRAMVRAGVVRTFQQRMVFDRLSVRANLEVAGLAARLGRRALPAAVDGALELLDLADWAGVAAAQVPFGVARRIAVGAAVLLRPALLLLDEPAAGLNEAESAELAVALRRVLGSGIGICVVDHNLEFVLPFCDRVVVLSSGRVIADGDRTVVEDPEVARVYLD